MANLVSSSSIKIKRLKLFSVCAVLLLLMWSEAAFSTPSKFDLRDIGKVTSVKNQGISGPCWAFAVLGACESNFLMQGLNDVGKAADFSEMHLAYFTYRDPKTERNFTSRIRSGTLRLEGNVFKAVAFLSRLSGPALESDLRYSMSEFDKLKKICKSPEQYRRGIRLKDVFFLSHGISPDDETRKKLIQSHGAIVVSIYSDLFSYHNIGSHYTYFNNEHGRETNHDVLLAGWDDEFPRDSFRPKPSKDGAWLVKNSWGTMRGNEGGYFWVPYEQYIYGGAAFIVERDNPRLRHYGYDELGWCGDVSCRWGANIFRAEGGKGYSKKEYLKEVAFYTSESNMSCEIYVYDLGTEAPKSPTDGRLVVSMKNVIEYPGYHTLSLPEAIPIIRGNCFSVVLKSLHSTPAEMRRPSYSENFAVHERESYFSRDGINWIDGTELKANACIKAFTVDRLTLSR